MLKAAAAERNKGPILQVLKEYIDVNSERQVLEIAAGYGTHTAHFAPHFPKATFQPSDISPDCLHSIQAYKVG